MITHIVLFKLADPADAPEIAARLGNLVGVVPTLRSMQAGADVVRSERSYDVGLVSTFDSLEDLEAYRVHPVHEEQAAWIRERATASVAVDFES